jgi:hypothetical protein
MAKMLSADGPPAATTNKKGLAKVKSVQLSTEGSTRHLVEVLPYDGKYRISFPLDK